MSAHAAVHSTVHGAVHATVLSAYTILALALSWPLLAQIATHIPGVPQWAFDESTFTWNIWYFKHSLIDQAHSPLHTELIYYPLGIDLILYTYNFYHALFAQPLMVAVNLPFAGNVALLASTVLSGYGTYLLVRYLLGRMGYAASRGAQWAAFAAGLLYAFASNRAIYAALGHYDMVTTQWIPFYALMLLRALDGRLTQRRRLGAASLAGLFFALNGLAEMITALFLAIFTLIVLACVALDRRETRTPILPPTLPPTLFSVLASLALTGIVAFAIWSPVLVPILVQFFTDDFSLRGWGEAIPLSTDLLGWFTPTILHPFFRTLYEGDLVDELRRVQLKALDDSVSGFRDVNTVFLGWASALLALIGFAVYRSRLRIWAWTAALFGIFTLGPFLQINGRYRFDLDGVEATFPLPYALLHFIPIIKANRAPNRNSVLLMLGLAVLAGFTLHWLLRRFQENRRGALRGLQTPVALLVCGLILSEHLALPLPLSDARVPEVYAQIAADPRPVSVMHLPLGWRDSFGVLGPEQTQLQYFQTVHGKPMLGGNISRAPDFKMDYFERIPFFWALTEIQFGRDVPPETLAAAEAQAAELMHLYNTGYVILTPPIPRRYPYVDHWQEAWEFVKRTLPLEPEPFWAEDGIEAYRVVLPEGDDAFTLELGEAGAHPYRGEGWDAAETDQPYGIPATWATAQESRLFVPLRQIDPNATYEIRAHIHPFAYPDSPTQSVTVRVNDTELSEQPLAAEWQEVTWQVPGAALIDGLNRVSLRWNYAVAPRTVLPGDRQIGATGVALPIDADIKAFAEGGFIALFDEAGDQIDASAGRRGINVTVLDRDDGRVLHKVGFDTTANEYESQALADFLAGIEAGQPVLVASYGDAGAHLTEAAVEGLRRLGAEVSVAELQGAHFAIAGVQGAAPGSAAVALDPVEAFLRISLNPDRRTLAAAVDWVEIRPLNE